MMSVDTDSGTGNFNSETKEFGMGFHPIWGFILHSESVSIDSSQVDDEFRVRGFSHTLNISGVLTRHHAKEYNPDEPVLLNAKDKLANYFYNNKTVDLGINQGLFPSIPTGETVDWKPVSLNINEGTYVNELRYTATLVYSRYPKDSEIKSITLFGKQFWDGSTVSYRRSYDRQSKKITQITGVNGSIKSPDNMSWDKALFYFDQANSLQVTAVTSNKDITEVEATKNFDQQTVTYNVSGYNVLDQGDAASTVINLFGHNWPGTVEISIENGGLRDTHLVGIDAIQQNISFNLSITAPEDMEFSDAMKHYQYAIGMIPKKKYPTFGDPYYRFGLSGDWEIERVSPSFNPNRKTVNVAITGYRIIRRRPVQKTQKAVNSGQPFLWSGASINYSASNDIESLIFSEQVSASGQAQIPHDMTEAEAKFIESEINNLKIFDHIKYPGYKLLGKNAYYDQIERTLTFSFQLKKLDFFDPFFVSGSSVRYRSPNDPDRKIGFSYGVFSGIEGLQFDIQIKEDYSRTEEDDRSFSFNVSGRLLSVMENGKPISAPNSVESVLDKLWQTYVIQDKKLNKNNYICNSASRSISINRMEATFNISFTDFGREDSDGRNYFYFPENMGSSGLLVSGTFDIDSPIMRYNTSTDGWSDGLVFQEGGLNVRTITLSAAVHKKEFENNRYRNKWANIEENIRRNGYLVLKGYKGRIKRLNLSGINLVKKTARVTATIEVQPDVRGTNSPSLVRS